MTKMIKIVFAVLPLIIAGNATAQDTPSNISSVAITNVRVFDGKKLSKPKTVVIENGLISSKKNAELTFDGQGGTLIPGFIDSHAHIKDIETLKQSAQWGITTILDMGTFPPEIVDSMRHLPGLPELRGSGVTASAPGSLQIEIMGAPQSSAVQNPEDAERFILERQSENADYIKVIVESPSIMESKALSSETVRSIVQSAHKHHMMVHAHAAFLESFQIAAAAGADIICHAPVDAPVDISTVKEMKKNKTISIPTLIMMKGTVNALKKPGMDYNNSKLSVEKIHKAGITIIVGTDSNNAEGSPVKIKHGEALHEEFELLVDAGLTPVEVLQSATVLPAKYLDLKDRGEIKPGLRADLVLIDGDPTLDISATRNIKAVWIGGIRFKNQ